MNTNQDAAQKLIFNKQSHYIEVTRRIRWAVILLVAATFPYETLGATWLSVLVVAATIYNLAWYWPWLYRQSWFGSFISMNASDNLFLVVLIVISGGITSPYYILFSFMAITASYWYGYKGLAVLGVLHVLFAASLWYFTEPVIADLDIVRTAFVLIAAIIINGILTERLTYSDRAERKLAVQASREKEEEQERLLSLINSIGDGVIAANKKGEVLQYNGAALDLLNTNSQLLGSRLDDYLKLYDEDGEEVYVSGLAQSVQGLLKRRDLILQGSDEDSINIDLTLSPITSTKGSGDVDGGYIVVLRDITKEKSMDEIKDEFVSVTSHELRTPVAIAEANLSTALMPKLAPENSETKTLIQKAYENVAFLSELINDLATLARAEHDNLDVELSMVDSAKLVQDLAGSYRDKIEEKGLELKVSIPDQMKPILSSESHIREILQNYLDNAVKYTHEGSVALLVESCNDGSGSVLFTVKDTGIGISASDKKRVKDKFYRSEDYRTRETGGTGLGLYVTDKLAERLSAETWFESQLNKGSAFYLKVPPVSKNNKDRSQAVETQVNDLVSNL